MSAPDYQQGEREKARRLRQIQHKADLRPITGVTFSGHRLKRVQRGVYEGRTDDGGWVVVSIDVPASSSSQEPTSHD